jgi:hypothetical protein
MFIKYRNGENPPFGSDYQIMSYKERKLGGYTAELTTRVAVVNEQAMNAILNATIMRQADASVKDLDAFHTLAKLNNDSVRHAVHTLKELKKRCKPSFFEYFFNTNSYKLKLEAKAAVDESTKLLVELVTNTTDFIPSALAWSKDLQFRLSLIDKGFPHSFRDKMCDSLQEYQEQIEHDAPLLLSPKAASML